MPVLSAVILYIILIALIREGKHTAQEPGVGTVITKFKGKAFDKESKSAFDQTDLRFPQIEPYGAFLMTKSVTQHDQELKNNFFEKKTVGKIFKTLSWGKNQATIEMIYDIRLELILCMYWNDTYSSCIF